ncbi:dephospho-CoA kinase [Seleniivibrio sp.]|uniref:dephospho-CoA kinase n=1 Tax=Seleniivibrio sp. TaxID=2898801 RepID=UPI0025F4CDBC|nr:dephospho-CoA kinase [Seleniivibrio sp.]MCD8553992.1 dephospho-CoA kinase [Seleniivibrio sp.]
MYLGLTGNIASGKSTAAMFFEKHGCYCIDTDEISRIVMSPGEKAYLGVVEAFGRDVVREDETLDRAKIRNIVFNDPEKRKILEGIVHPAILEYETKAVGRIKGKDDKAIIITQAALTVESGSYKRFDWLVVVYTDPKVQLQRVMKRDSITQEQAKKIIDAQMPIEEKLKYANFIIDNSADIDRLEREVRRVIELIKLIGKCTKSRRERVCTNLG